MGRKIYLTSVVLLLAAGMWACKKEPVMLYSDTERINFSDSVTVNHTFGYDGPEVTSAVVYLRVNTIGRLTGYDRSVKLVQVPEYDMEIVTNDQGLIVDTVYTQIENMAVEGVHYEFADSDQCMVEAGRNTALIPVTLLRDRSLEQGDVRLRLSVAANDDFLVGDRITAEKTIVFSERLLKPAFWNNNVNIILGIWSERKQLFMYRVTGEIIDQVWFDMRYSLPNAAAHYRNLFANALAEFNADPANIASGEAPMVDENRQPIIFANQGQ